MPKAKRPSTIVRMVEALHQARQELLEAKSSFEVEQAMFEQKNKKLIDRVEAATLAVQLNDETLRNAMIKRFEETGEIALGPGLDIRHRNYVHIENEDELFNWAVQNGAFLLELNTALVHKIALAVPDVFPGVKVVEHPTAYITKDLTKAMQSF